MIQLRPQSVMPVCKQLHPVAHANTAFVVFQQPHLFLEKQKTKVTEVRIPLAEEYSMADVWCVVPGRVMPMTTEIAFSRTQYGHCHRACTMGCTMSCTQLTVITNNTLFEHD